jgi:hypothetical protein
MSDGLLPTFRDDRDRLVYLLAEYRVTVSILAVLVSLWLIFFPPTLPEIPPEWLYFSGAFLLILPAGWIAGLKIADYLWTPDTVTVAVCDDSPDDGEDYSVFRVPKAVWQDKQTEGATPLYPENGSVDAVVTRWDWFEDTDRLIVRGVERSDLTPAEALEDRQKIEEYHDNHHELRRSYSRLKATLQSKITEVHDLVIMRMMEEQEEAQLAIDTKPSDIIGDMEDAVDDLPDGPGPDRHDAEPQLGESDVTMTMNSDGTGLDAEAATDGGREQ